MLEMKQTQLWGLKAKTFNIFVNKDIVSLTGGRLNPSIDRDMLMIDSKTNLLVYDINENANVFDKEV
jgi:hypothetical protein